MTPQVLLHLIKKYPIAVVSTVILLLLLVFIFLRADVAPSLQEVESELRSSLEVINNNERKGRGLEADLVALDELVAKIPDHIFVSSERALNTNFFYGFEDQVNILITEVKPVGTDYPILSKGGPNALSIYSVLVYEVSIQAEFNDFLEFLHLIHSSDRFMRVSSFQVTENRDPSVASQVLGARVRVVVMAEKD